MVGGARACGGHGDLSVCAGNHGTAEASVASEERERGQRRDHKANERGPDLI